MPDQPTDSSNRIEEIRETNAWFLDSVFFYGDRFYQFARRLIDALSRLHQAVRDGQLPPTAARRAAAFIIACGSVLAAGFVHGSIQRQKRSEWKEMRRQVRALAQSWPHAAL
ncbi:ABCG15 [Symbiodinium sp. KB8]|nr:ABCG15 [Symbiodinium sp. KB8]